MSDGSPPVESGSGPIPPRVPVVHAVTDDGILTRDSFPERALAVMQALGPRGAVHLRGQIIPARRLLALAEALRLAEQETGCWLVVNDRLDIALGAGARAVQLTSRSIRIADARRIAPDVAFGASVHSVEDAHDAEHEGANWLVAGHVFRTASHEGREGRGLPFLSAVCSATKLPVLAIGGVTPERTPQAREAGAYGVAAIRGIWAARDAEQAAREYLSAYDGDDASAVRQRGDRER